jgi:hypothetical protein
MSKDPERCCVMVNGQRCTGKPLYKIGASGFCERHKPSPELVRERTKRNPDSLVPRV